MLDILWDALLDTLKLLPFLFLTYVVMEYLEHHWKGGGLLRRAGRFGPLLGGLLGVVPQCGFSAAAAGLYAGRVISVGTMLAVFLSTSDEMLPLLLSRGVPAGEVFQILALKAAAGIVCGFLIDLVFRRPAAHQIDALCDEDHCGCGHRNIFAAALFHTAEIAVFLLAFNIVLGLLFHYAGENALQRVLSGNPVLSLFLAALVGLIPNCAASVALTTLYLDGLLPFGAMMAGLLVGAGMGLLVLFRLNRNGKENLLITVGLYGLGVALGGVMGFLRS